MAVVCNSDISEKKRFPKFYVFPKDKGVCSYLTKSYCINAVSSLGIFIGEEFEGIGHSPSEAKINKP